jgi:hypothetical protein
VATATRTLRTDSFIGGLNLRADPFQLGDNESPDMLNMNVDPVGGFAMRGGTDRWNTSAIGAIGAGLFTPRDLFSWVRTTPQLMCPANGVVYQASSGTFTSTTVTYTSDPTFAPWDRVLYVSTGVGTANMMKWDGSSKTNLTASATAAWQDSLASPTGTHMPRSNFVATHGDRMWVASTFENGTAYPNRVRFSHPGFPESWRQIDYIDVVGGGDGITALVPFKGTLYVFKQNSIHAIFGYDTDTFQLSAMTEALGAPGPNAVAVTEDAIWFFDWPDGLHAFNGSEITDVFEKIRPLIQTAQISESQLAQVFVSHMNAKVWVSLPTGAATTPSFTFVFDPTIRAWVRHQLADGLGFGPCTDFVSSAGTRLCLAAHPTQPYVLRSELSTVYQDNVTGSAANFLSYYKTRWIDADITAAKKMWRRPSIVTKVPISTTILDVQVFHDWKESAIRRVAQLTLTQISSSLKWAAVGSEPDGILGWGEAPWGAAPTGAMYKRGSNLGLARAIQLRVAGPGGLPWGINSITYTYNLRRVR